MNYTKAVWTKFDFTKNPELYEGGHYQIVGDNQRCNVAIIPAHWNNAKANANLIAAAPDMYEAIKWSIEELERLAPSFGDMAWSIITVLNGAKLEAEGKEE